MTNRELEIQNRIAAIAWDIVNLPDITTKEHAQKWGFSKWYIRKIKDSLTIKDGGIYRKGKLIGAVDSDARAARTN